MVSMVFPRTGDETTMLTIFETDETTCSKCKCDLTVDPALETVKTVRKEFRDNRVVKVVTDIQCGFCGGYYD